MSVDSSISAKDDNNAMGRVAQLVERVLSMHEVWGSIPHLSILLLLFIGLSLQSVLCTAVRTLVRGELREWV